MISVKQKAVRQNVSMYQEEWEIVETVNKQYGLKTTSATLRFIVTQYQQLTTDKIAKPLQVVTNGQDQD